MCLSGGVIGGGLLVRRESGAGASLAFGVAPLDRPPPARERQRRRLCLLDANGVVFTKGARAIERGRE